MTSESKEPISSGEECRGQDGTKCDENLLSLLVSESPDILQEYVVAFLSPQETSDLLAVSRLIALLSPSTWKHMLTQIRPLGDDEARWDGKDRMTQYWKHRFRHAFYTVRLME